MTPRKLKPARVFVKPARDHDLERRILDALLARSDASARELAATLYGEGYTGVQLWAVMGALDSLVKAGSVGRTGDARVKRWHTYWLIVAQAVMAW